MRTLLMVLALATTISACTYPVTRVEQSTERPTLIVKGLAPDSAASIVVDGVSYGHADYYDGENYAISLDPGVHVVEVRDGDRILFNEKVFLANNSSKAIKVN